MGIGRLAGILVCCLAGPLLIPAQVQRFAITQVYPQLPRMMAFVDLVDSDGQVPAGLVPADFSAKLRAQAVPVVGLRSFESSGEGVAYALVLDISRSIPVADFNLIRALIARWIASLRPHDRVAICTFGDTYKLVSDFKNDRQQLTSAVMGLQIQDWHTHLYEGVKNTIELARRVDSDLPARRVILLFSDGKDEGSAVTGTAVFDELGTTHIPVYAIGYSRLPRAERLQYLEVTHRFADSSGGIYEEATPHTLERAYALIQSAILRVLILDLSCPNCPADGGSYPLQITFSKGGQTLTSSVNIVPARALGRSVSQSPRHPQESPMTAWILSALGVAIVASLLVVWFKRKRQTPPEPPSRPGSVQTDTTVVPPPEPIQAPPVTGLPMRLAVVAGREPGRIYQLQLRNKLVIGRAKECDMVLNDPQISNRHCEMALSQNHVIIYDLESKNSTFVNGVPVVGRQKLGTEDLLRVGETEFRVHFDENKIAT